MVGGMETEADFWEQWDEKGGEGRISRHCVFNAENSLQHIDVSRHYPSCFT
jgi:hypothetical protein